jgi:hypothetical protein
MIRDFKEVFEGFLKDRMNDTNDCILIENTIFCKQDEVITSFLEKLKKEDPKQGDILDMAISYVKYSITESLYEQGFRDGIEFQKIASPIIEIK